jgi:hypothetical protein
MVQLWELASGQVRIHYKRQQNLSHWRGIASLAFSPDSTLLATGGDDRIIMIWDLMGQRTTRRQQKSPLPAERLNALWDDLASEDAGKAFDAIGLLAAVPKQAIPLLKSKLRPAPATANRQQITRLIADLDSEEFAVRQKAMGALRQLGERVEPALREALQSKLSLEARKRIEELRKDIRASAASPENLRNLRAVEVLEHIGTPDARQMLKTLANGATEARLTREAKASLERLTKRPNPEP